MLRILAILFGIVFIGIGILGFIPSYTPNNHLLGIFHVNAVHNIVHFITGLCAFWCSFSSALASKLFFQIFGIIYGAVAILGFYYMERPILGILANNLADAWLHLLIAIVSLWIGFGVKGKKEKK